MSYVYAKIIPSMGWTVFQNQIPVYSYECSCHAALHTRLGNVTVTTGNSDKLKLWLAMRDIMKERGIPC